MNETKDSNYQQVLKAMMVAFKGREDVVPRYWNSEHSSGYAPICHNEWKSGICQKPCKDCPNKSYVPLSADLLMKHIKGDHILGVYPLLTDNTCWFMAFDFDNHDGTHDPLKDVLPLYEVCGVQEIPCYVLRSKSGNGYHVYIFFDRPVPAWKARVIGLALLQEAQVVDDGDNASSFDKLFPGQDELSPGKPLGNLIALPFQGQAAKAGHTLFLDPSTKFQAPYPDQMEVLRSIDRVTEGDLDRIIGNWGLVKDSGPVPKNHAKKTSTKTTEPITPVGIGKIPEGQRNKSLTSNAGSLRQRGMNFEEIKEVLLMENQKRCVPPLPEAEVEAIARSIAGYPAGPSKEEPAAKLAWAKETIAGLAEKAKADPGAPFEAPIPLALMVIKEKDSAEWARIKKVLQDAKVSLGDLKNAMKQAGAEARTGDNPNGDGQSGPAHPYCIKDGVLTLRRRGRDGDYLVPLCNFNACLIGERVYDDGAEQKVVYRVSGERQNGSPLPPIEVLASQFDGMSWVSAWGAQAFIYAGQALKEHTRAAIRTLSREVPREMIYGHIGWKKIGGKWIYLHGGEGIGRDGLVSGISMSLGDGRLKEYCLPEPTIAERLKCAVRASLRLLKLVPARIAYPIIAGIYRAPLAEIVPIDFSMFLVGPSGSQKTELSAQMQAHFGPGFHRGNLPCNWSGTSNAIEGMAFHAKDSLLTIDDFAPTGTINEIRRMHSMADRILRGAGNLSGRQRMKADCGMRLEYYPRGLIISSGEDIPKGHSLRGRMLVSEISHGNVDLEILTQVQHDAAEGLLAQSMSGYLQWLASRFDDLKRDLPNQQFIYRTEARKELRDAHDRTAETVASLSIGLSQFLTFAEEVGAITTEEAKKYTEDGWNALIGAGKSQAHHQESEDVVNQFLRLLTAAINSGAAHLVNTKDNGRPDDAESWGWRAPAYGDGPLGSRIGWIKGQDVHLDPESAFAVVQKLAQSQGTALPVTQQTLWKRLGEKGYLASTEPGRNTTRLMIAGKRHRVIHLHKAALGGVEVENLLLENLQPEECDAKSPGWPKMMEFTAEDMLSPVH